MSTGTGAYGVVAMSGHRILSSGAGVINLVTGARTDDGLLALWGNTGCDAPPPAASAPSTSPPVP